MLPIINTLGNEFLLNFFDVFGLCTGKRSEYYFFQGEMKSFRIEPEGKVRQVLGKTQF